MLSSQLSNLLETIKSFPFSQRSIKTYLFAVCYHHEMSLILGRRCPLLIAAAKRSFTQSLVRGFSSYSSDNDRQKIALVVGSSGCLGRSVVQHLRKDLGMQVVGADVVPSPKDDGGASLDKYIQLPTFSQPAAVSDVTAALVEGLSSALADDEEIDAIICVAGGWKGDPPLPRPDCSNEEFMTSIKEYGDTINSMLEMNLYPVLAAGYAANRFMADEGECRFSFYCFRGSNVPTCTRIHKYQVCLWPSERQLPFLRPLECWLMA